MKKKTEQTKVVDSDISVTITLNINALKTPNKGHTQQNALESIVKKRPKKIN